MIEHLVLSRQHLRLFGALMNEDPEEEAVAILFGREGEPTDHWVIEPLFNEAPEPERDRRCEVTVEQLKPIMAKQRALGRDVVAWWHSHPHTAAVPSEEDHGNPDVPVVLISSGAAMRYDSQRHRAWWIAPGEAAVEIPLGPA